MMDIITGRASPPALSLSHSTQRAVKSSLVQYVIFVNPKNNKEGV